MKILKLEPYKPNDFIPSVENLYTFTSEEWNRLVKEAPLRVLYKSDDTIWTTEDFY